MIAAERIVVLNGCRVLVLWHPQAELFTNIGGPARVPPPADGDGDERVGVQARHGSASWRKYVSHAVLPEVPSVIALS